MVQGLLRSILGKANVQLLLGCALTMALAPLCVAGGKTSKTQAVSVPRLELEGGRRLTFERTFWSEREVHIKRGFWSKLLDVVAGAPEFHGLISPYGVAADSRGRIIVTDPGAGGVHIFDFVQQKYKFVSREKE